jgi:hypothetical protein
MQVTSSHITFSDDSLQARVFPSHLWGNAILLESDAIWEVSFQRKIRLFHVLLGAVSEDCTHRLSGRGGRCAGPTGAGLPAVDAEVTMRMG